MEAFKIYKHLLSIITTKEENDQFHLDAEVKIDDLVTQDISKSDILNYLYRTQMIVDKQTLQNQYLYPFMKAIKDNQVIDNSSMWYKRLINTNELIDNIYKDQSLYDLKLRYNAYPYTDKPNFQFRPLRYRDLKLQYNLELNRRLIKPALNKLRSSIVQAQKNYTIDDVNYNLPIDVQIKKMIHLDENSNLDLLVFTKLSILLGFCKYCPIKNLIMEDYDLMFEDKYKWLLNCFDFDKVFKARVIYGLSLDEFDQYLALIDFWQHKLYMAS